LVSPYYLTASLKTSTCPQISNPTDTYKVIFSISIEIRRAPALDLHRVAKLTISKFGIQIPVEGVELGGWHVEVEYKIVYVVRGF